MRIGDVLSIRNESDYKKLPPGAYVCWTRTDPNGTIMSEMVELVEQANITAIKNNSHPFTCDTFHFFEIGDNHEKRKVSGSHYLAYLKPKAEILSLQQVSARKKQADTNMDHRAVDELESVEMRMKEKKASYVMVQKSESLGLRTRYAILNQDDVVLDSVSLAPIFENGKISPTPG